MRTHEANGNNAIALESMARETLLKMTPTKWRLARILEFAMQLIKPMTPSRPLVKNWTEPPATILVVEYWNLGDLAILVPFLTNLRRAFTHAKISLLINEGLESLLDGQGLVDEFIPVRVPWARHFNRWRKYNPFSLDWIFFARTIRLLRKRGFDWAFSGRMDVRDNALLWLTGALRRIGYGIAGGGSFLTDRITPDLSRPHRADLWLQLLEAVSGVLNAKRVDFRLATVGSDIAEQFLRERGIPPGTFLVGIHPGARNATRRWGKDRFAQVARRLLQEADVHILWFSEPNSSTRIPHLDRCHSVSLDFRRFLAVHSRCHLLLCNDSGPMHLANLLNVPVVAVFGPQKPEWYGPRGPHDRVMIRPEFSCRPCWDYCIFDQPYCLRAISVDEVYDAVKDQMNRIFKSQPTRASSADNVEMVSYD
jgi:heptosyltransferase II